MKNKRWLIVVLMVMLIGTVSIFAVSRHTKAEAPVRFTATIDEGTPLTKVISGYDPDGDPMTITVEDLPTGAALGPQVTQPAGYNDPDVPGPAPAGSVWYTRELTWTPTYDQAGTYTIYIHAVDNSGDDDWVKYQITVTNVNRPPVL